MECMHLIFIKKLLQFVQQVLPDAEYSHFLQLCVAVRICSCNLYKNLHPIATKLFKLYIENYVTLYGRHTIGSNVHNLAHVTEDMQRCGVGNLMEISTYKFENALRLLTLKIKHSNRPLEQVVRRNLEMEQIIKAHKSIYFHRKPFVPVASFKINYLNNCFFKKIEIAPNVFLSSRHFDFMNPNNQFKCNNSWFMTKSNDIVRMEYGQQKGADFIIFGKKIISKEPFFRDPIDSTKLDIFSSDCDLDNKTQMYNISQIKAKMLALTIDEKTTFTPLLHTLEYFNQL